MTGTPVQSRLGLGLALLGLRLRTALDHVPDIFGRPVIRTASNPGWRLRVRVRVKARVGRNGMVAT